MHLRFRGLLLGVVGFGVWRYWLIRVQTHGQMPMFWGLGFREGHRKVSENSPRISGFLAQVKIRLCLGFSFDGSASLPQRLGPVSTPI